MNIPKSMLSRVAKIREWNEVNVILTGPGKGEATLVVVNGNMYGFENKPVEVKVNGATVGYFKRVWLDQPGEAAVWTLYGPDGKVKVGQEGTARECVASLVTIWAKKTYPTKADAAVIKAGEKAVEQIIAAIEKPAPSKKKAAIAQGRAVKTA